jgi:hypothetical protein
LDISVHGEQSMKITLNMIHCSSSHAFEEMPKSLRLIAFAAETMTTTTISQETHLPSRNVTESIARLTASKACTVTESPSIPAFEALRTAPPGQYDDS